MAKGKSKGRNGGGGGGVQSDNLSDLIKEAASKGKRNIEVTFKPTYDKNKHSNLPEALKNSLKKGKKSTFDVAKEGMDILSLKKNKDVSSVKWVD